MTEFEKYTNQRGNENLYSEGYYYNHEKTIKDEIKWRCLIRGCKGILVFKNNQISIKTKHSHVADFYKIKNLKLMNLLKNKAKQSSEPAKNIITSFTPTIEMQDLKETPCYKYLNDQITKTRNKILNHFILNEEIPQCLQHDKRGGQFLRFDSGVGKPERYIVFFSDFSKSISSEAINWIIDGTFYSVPKDFYQLLIIHTKIFAKTRPIIYILSTGKTEEIYLQIFEKIKNLIEYLPNFLIIDFEISLKKSLSKVYTTIPLFGCLFHFGQMCWRKIQKNNLTQEYKAKSEIYIFLRRLLCLPFVPVSEVHNYFKMIHRSLKYEMPINLVNFLNYFIDNFIGKYEDNESKKPRYEIEFWNVNFRVKNLLPRTTNSAEAYHRNLNNIVQHAHPNFAKLIDIFIKEDEIQKLKISQNFKNIDIEGLNYKKDMILKVICDNFKLYDGIKFLDAICEVYNWHFE